MDHIALIQTNLPHRRVLHKHRMSRSAHAVVDLLVLLYHHSPSSITVYSPLSLRASGLVYWYLSGTVLEDTFAF